MPQNSYEMKSWDPDELTGSERKGGVGSPRRNTECVLEKVICRFSLYDLESKLTHGATAGLAAARPERRTGVRVTDFQPPLIGCKRCGGDRARAQPGSALYEPLPTSKEEKAADKI